MTWDDTGKGNPWGVTKSMAKKGQFPYKPFYASRVPWPANSGPGRKSPVYMLSLNRFGWRSLNWFRPDYPTHRDTPINQVYREELLPQPPLLGDTAAECVVVLPEAREGVAVRVDGIESMISLTDRQGKAYFLLPKAGTYRVSCGRWSKEVRLEDMSRYCGKPGFADVPHVILND